MSPVVDSLRSNIETGQMFGGVAFQPDTVSIQTQSLTFLGTYSIQSIQAAANLELLNYSAENAVTPGRALSTASAGGMYLTNRKYSGGAYSVDVYSISSGGGRTLLGALAGIGLVYPPATTLGPSLGIAPVIAAGVYAVQTAASTTTFTITSVQTGQPDFTVQTVAGDFNYNEISHIDTVGPSFIGPYLYTSPAVEGIAQSNYPPPTCRDVALFRTTAFYANTKQTSFNAVTILKTDAADNGTRIYLGGSGAYVTASTTAEDVPSGVYRIFTTGNADVRAKQTIESLARVVNSNWRKYRTLIYPVGVGIAQFANFAISGVVPADLVQFKHTNAAGTTVIVGTYTPNNLNSEAVQNKNFLFYSKSNIPDAVGLGNYLRIGSDAKAILRIIASRDALFVFKEEGCYIVRGYGAPWQVDPYDLTLSLSIRDSLAALDNAVFGAFTRGVFKVSDSNVELISLPVQDKLEPYLAGSLNEDAQIQSFGIGDNSDHKYLLWLPTQVGLDAIPGLVYVFDTFTSEWSTWDNRVLHAVSYKEQKLLQSVEMQCESIRSSDLASGTYPALAFERKTLTGADICGPLLYTYPDTSTVVPNVIELSAYDSVAKTITISGNDSANLPIKKYDILIPNVGENQTYENAIMVAEDKVDGSRVIHIENDSVPWFTPGGFAKVYKAIKHGWKFTQTFPETPAATNHFQELAVSFREAFWSALTASFEVPLEQLDTYQTAQFVSFKGVKHFGPLRRTSKNNYIRTYVPRQAQRGTTIVCGIETGAAGKAIESNGVTVILTQGPTSFQRR